MKKVLLSLVLLGNMTFLVCMERVRTFEGLMALESIAKTVAEQARDKGMKIEIQSFEPDPPVRRTELGLALKCSADGISCFSPWGHMPVYHHKSPGDISNIKHIFDALRQQAQLRFSYGSSVLFLEDAEHPIAFDRHDAYSGTDEFIFPADWGSGYSVYEIALVPDGIRLPTLRMPDSRGPLAIGAEDAENLSREWGLLMAGYEARQQVEALTR